MQRKHCIRVMGAWLAASIAFTAPVMAGDPQAAPANATPAEAATDDVDLARTLCAPGEEKVLPADFYYCIAERSFGHGEVEQSQRLFKVAASWASKPAQYVLGVMALNGDHQPVNRPLGLAWLALSAERPNSSFRQAYETAYNSATPQERERSRSLLREMLPTYGDAVAAPRAERRYADGMARIARVASRGDGISCMPADQNLGGDPYTDNHCMTSQAMVQVIDKAAVNVFDGWTGHVQVGELSKASHN
ncbi:hypothetical protein [Dyella sp. C11]|uniref:hypothetical protein n=1 Tax=Dyella sp. C11 TaxID=2126991 RepID=UPI001300A944|nr:hypothetical protein [Dyella sp. C11]